MRKKPEGFTLIEIAISVAILLLLLTLAIPSMNGVIADRRLRHSLDELNNLVTTAQERSVTDRRAYLISWGKDELVVHPESSVEGEGDAPIAMLKLQKGEAYMLKLPAALMKDPPGDWIFWPSGTCEPAEVTYKGDPGTWTATYSPLTGRAEILKYATR